MSSKKRVTADTKTRIENFHNRWNIALSESERWDQFRDRVLNAYSDRLGYLILGEDNCEDEFYSLIGLHQRKTRRKNIAWDYDRLLSDSPTYNFFVQQSDMKKFILGLEVIFWMETIPSNVKSEFSEKIKESISLSNVPLEMRVENDDVLFYPAGAKLLDQKLVNDNLDWLTGFPKTYAPFKQALHELGIPGKERNVVDNLRLSLELLLKTILNNNKSLENQRADLGKYLKEKNVSIEISNLAWIVIDYYCKYQNDKVKHNDSAQPDEVEFILYLTGTIIRFLVTRL